jgi:hypothetical protein
MKVSWRMWVAVAVVLALTPAAQAAIIGVAGGPVARPGTIGPFTMTAYRDTCGGCLATAIPAPGGDVLSLTGTEAAARALGTGWGTWNPGYPVGSDVWYAPGDGPTSMSLTLPAGRDAFYFYAEPEPCVVVSITATSGGASVTIPIDGFSGASYFGFYTTAGETLSSISVSSGLDFAVGEFGEHVQEAVIPEPGSLGLLAAGAMTLLARRRRKA